MAGRALFSHFRKLLYVPLEEGYNFAIDVIKKFYYRELCKH